MLQAVLPFFCWNINKKNNGLNHLPRIFFIVWLMFRLPCPLVQVEKDAGGTELTTDEFHTASREASLTGPLGQDRTGQDRTAEEHSFDHVCTPRATYLNGDDVMHHHAHTTLIGGLQRVASSTRRPSEPLVKVRGSRGSRGSLGRAEWWQRLFLGGTGYMESACFLPWLMLGFFVFGLESVVVGGMGFMSCLRATTRKQKTREGL